MMAVSGAFPYLTPSSDVVSFGEWTVLTGEWVPLPSTLETWDSDASLRVSQSVVIDREKLLAQTRLPSDVELAITATWTSDTSGMKGRIAQVVSTTSGTFVLDGELVGKQISGSLQLSTTVSVFQTALGPPGAAISKGAVLASSSTYVDVEPAVVRFPIAVVDFSRTKIDSDASWRLITTTDMSAPFFGEFQLLINSRDKDLVHAIESRSPTPIDLTLIAEMESQVASLMFEFALLSRTAILEHDDWAADSTGRILKGFIDAAEAHGLSELSPDPLNRAAEVARVAGLVRSRGRGRQFT